MTNIPKKELVFKNQGRIMVHRMISPSIINYLKRTRYSKPQGGYLNYFWRGHDY
jgi:hypothetical protein